MIIRRLLPNENPPMSLLLLADPSKNKVEGYLEKGDCFVLEEDENIIGAYVLLPIGPDTIELVNLSVEEKFQRQGIGKRLIKHAIQLAQSKGYGKIEVGTGNSSIYQLALYQKCGFRMEEVDKDFFVRNYSEKIVENGIQCRDMIRLKRILNEANNNLSYSSLCNIDSSQE